MQRKKHDPAFKAKVALEVAKGLKTVNEIAGDYGVHPTMITKGCGSFGTTKDG